MVGKNISKRTIFKSSQRWVDLVAFPGFLEVNTDLGTNLGENQRFHLGISCFSEK
jgi:hypothetical protein